MQFERTAHWLDDIAALVMRKRQGARGAFVTYHYRMKIHLNI
jgi:hypothetical protein